MRPGQRANTRSRFGPTTDSLDRRPRPVGVGGVAAQQQHAVAAELGEPRDVGRRAPDRRLVELVVAGEQHGPELAAQDHPDHVRDRVGEVHELDLERPRLHLLAGRQHLEIRLAQPVLVELGAPHRDRQLAAVDHRHRGLPQVAQHPRQRADVVLVTVRDDDRLDVLDVLAQVREVRQHEVDPHHLGGREAQPAVDHDDLAVVLDDGHVLADLADAPEREDAQGAAHAVAALWSSPWRSSIALTSAVSCSSRVDHRQAAAARVEPEQVERRLRARRAGGEEERRVDVAQRGVDLGPRVGLVEQALHLRADDVRGDADAARAALVEGLGEDRVVARQHGEPVDRLQLVGVGLLDRLDPVDLGQLGEQVGRHVDRGTAGDVVEDHRGAGGRARDLLEVADDPAPVRLVVVRRHRQHGLRARLDHGLGQVDRVARVVGARAGHHRALGAELGDQQADELDLLLVGHRRGLAGGAGDHQPVGAVLEQVPADADGRLLVDRAVRRERRHDRGEQAFVGAHEPHDRRVSRPAGRRWRAWARGSDPRPAAHRA